jgi:hypothetical protein
MDIYPGGWIYYSILYYLSMSKIGMVRRRWVKKYEYKK